MGDKKNILVTGADGQLGMEFRTLAAVQSSLNFFFVSKDELSITDKTAVEKYFSKNNFHYCINCAAYTAVDKAETEKDIAFEINAVAPGSLATICKNFQVKLIHISTDYVFDGNGIIPYLEQDKTSPVNIYGSSKLAGEINVLHYNGQALIIRTSWVYSSYGKNFVKTILRLMKEKESIGIVNDQFGCPTYAADLASVILAIINTGKDSIAGIFHYCNEGSISWYEFALEIKKLTGSACIINPINTAAYPVPAKRPQYSVLDTTKIRDTFGVSIPGWQESLIRCLKLLAMS